MHTRGLIHSLATVFAFHTVQSIAQMSGIVLQTTRGVLGLIGPSIDDLALRDALESVQCLTNTSLKYQAPYHVTFLTKAELREIPSDRLDKLQADTRHIHSAGIGGNLDTGVLFVVIIWAAGQHLRKQLGLPPKHFHITFLLRINMTWIREVTHSFPTNSRLHLHQISWITCHLHCIRLDSIKELRNSPKI